MTKKIRVKDFRVVIKAKGFGNPNKNGKEAVEGERNARLTSLPDVVDEITQKANQNFSIMKKYVQIKTNADGTTSYEVMPGTSSDFMRSTIFGGTLQSDVAQTNDPVFLGRLAATASGLLRGHLMADMGVNRASPISISRAKGKGVILNEIGTKSGVRDATSMVWREVVGEIEWEAQMVVRINDMSFLPLDPHLSRSVVPLDGIDAFIGMLNSRHKAGLSTEDIDLYNRSVNDDALPVRGLVLPEAAMRELITTLFELTLTAQKGNGTTFFEVYELDVSATTDTYDTLSLGSISLGPDMTSQIKKMLESVEFVTTYKKADTEGAKIHKLIEAKVEAEKKAKADDKMKKKAEKAKKDSEKTAAKVQTP